jgi:DNA-binding MarR family transcriptional regulator
MGPVVAEESMTQRLVFLLGKLGQQVTGQFAEQLEPMGLRPRHCAVLELLVPAPMTQLELARRIGVAPSVVVDMLDELQGLGAVRRVRDEADRRRHLVELTTKGRTLGRRALRAAGQLDAEILGALSTAEAQSLLATLAKLAGSAGVVPADRPGGSPA